MAAAFILEVHSEFKQDPNEETAALLRVLIYKMDNTTFGDNAPTLPQWSGPPHTIIQVQALLLASLASSLFSAFLAMLGKQWLNRYASVDMRGSVIERSQNRQRKFDGIITWYFDQVMEALPLMLQIALLLLGCALSHYLWEINTTIASVVIGVTSFGVLFYFFIVVAGAAFVSCPYQTPGARLLRGIPDAFRRIPHIPGALYPVLSASLQHSFFYNGVAAVYKISTCSPPSIGIALLFILPLSILLFIDVLYLLVALPWILYLHLQQGSQQQTAVLDLHCILWTLQTSLDEPVRLSTLEYLTTTDLINLDPTLAVDCFNILLGCINATGNQVVITEGLEELATVSALCSLHTLSYLILMDPTPRALEDVHQKYTKTLPFGANFHHLQFSHILGAIHHILYPTHVNLGGDLQGQHHHQLPPPEKQNQWGDYRPSTHEYTIVVHALTRVAKFEYQRGGNKKVPRWLLHFALHSLFQDPSTSVVSGCLSIIAIDLCPDPSDSTWHNLSIAQQLQVITTSDPGVIYSKRKALSALFPYAVSLEQYRGGEMVDAILCAARASNAGSFMWHHVSPFITTLFDRESPSLNQIIVLASPHVPWSEISNKKSRVTRWAVAVSALPYTEAVGQSVVDALLQIASIDSLRPCIPISIWAWCNYGGQPPPLPPINTIAPDTLGSLNIYRQHSLSSLISSHISQPYSEVLRRYLSSRSSSISIPPTMMPGPIITHAPTIYPIASTVMLPTTMPAPHMNNVYPSTTTISTSPIIIPTAQNIRKMTHWEQLSLPPGCLGRSKGNGGAIVHHVRELGDIRILKSYFLLVWSEWDHIDDESGGFVEMQISIQEDFSGIMMQYHREDLIKRLDDVLEQLDQGFTYLVQYKPGIHEHNIQIAKGQYGELKRVLLEVDRKAFTRKSPW